MQLMSCQTIARSPATHAGGSSDRTAKTLDELQEYHLNLHLSQYHLLALTFQ